MHRAEKKALLKELYLYGILVSNKKKITEIENRIGGCQDFGVGGGFGVGDQREFGEVKP